MIAQDLIVGLFPLNLLKRKKTTCWDADVISVNAIKDEAKRDSCS